MASIARRTRARSSGGMRLRDFRADPARTTSHSFLSAEFIEGHVITTFVRGSAASNSSQLGWRGSFFREFPAGDADAVCRFSRGNILPFHLESLEISPKAFPSLESKRKGYVGINQHLPKFLPDHFGDERLQFLD